MGTIRIVYKVRMMGSIMTILLAGLLLTVLPCAESFGQSVFNQIEWMDLPDLPPPPGRDYQPGLAAPFTGVSNGVLLVAGGSNFPGIPVWEGGQKMYYSNVYALEKLSNGTYIWHTGSNIPHEAAHGVSISLEGGVLCIGGKNNERAFEDVFLMTWSPEQNTVEIDTFPPLPFPMDQMAGALVDQVIYIAGGIANGTASNAFLCLDLADSGSDDFQWKRLPDFPGPPRIQPVAVGQNAAEEMHFYLFSGSSYPEDEPNPLILCDGLEYNPVTGEWESIPEIRPGKADPISLHGGSAVPIGTQHILFTGGVNKEIFSRGWQRERFIERERAHGDTTRLHSLLQAQTDYFTYPPEYYKFNDKVIAYHTITQTWTMIQKYPFPAPAGAPMVKWNDGFAVVSGEIKPGVRTPVLHFGIIQQKTAFGWVNWSVLILYLTGMVYLGVYFMKREKGTETFFRGGQRIPWWAAGMSIFATMLSAITYMAIPAKTFTTDWKYFMMAITIFLMVYPIVHFYLPFFRKLNVTTAYEYLEKRFNYTTRFLASGAFLVFMVARMALVLFLPSLALTTVTGINIYLCILMMGVITIIYCTMGGVEAVIWGDVIQGFVLLGGALLAVVFMIAGTEGGWSKVIEITLDHDKLKVIDLAFDLTKATFWVVLLGGLANNLISYSSDQAVIQRYLTTKDEKSAAKGLWFNGIMSIVVSLIFYFIGTALFAFYKTQPQELNAAMANPDSIFPHFIMTRMPVGIAGIMIAAIFAATMSTLSSNVNSISTAFTTDMYSHFRPGSTDGKKLRVARFAGIIAGGLGILLALLMATWNILSLFDYFNTILGLLTGGLGGLFVMGIFFPRIHSRGAIMGLVFSFVLLLYVKMYSPISFLIYGFIGIVSSVGVAYLFSMMVKEKQKNQDELTIRSLSGISHTSTKNREI
jgi:cyclically-permuted mutarotase family protein